MGTHPNFMKPIEQMTRAEAIAAIKGATFRGNSDIAMRIYVEKRISYKVYRAAVDVGEAAKAKAVKP